MVLGRFILRFKYTYWHMLLQSSHTTKNHWIPCNFTGQLVGNRSIQVKTVKVSVGCSTVGNQRGDRRHGGHLAPQGRDVDRGRGWGDGRGREASCGRVLTALHVVSVKTWKYLSIRIWTSQEKGYRSKFFFLSFRCNYRLNLFKIRNKLF